MVYQHPDDAEALVKVVHDGKLPLHREAGRFRSWERRLGLARYGARREFRRELSEITALRLRLGAVPDWIADVRGMVATDLGPGMVVQKIRGHDGGLAPTLGAVLRAKGLTGPMRELILRLGEAIQRSQIVVNNLSLHNIVVGFEPERGERLVLIDCVGEKVLVPVHRLFPWWNRRDNARHLRRLMLSVERVAAAKAG